MVDLSRSGAHAAINTFIAGNVRPAPSPSNILIIIKAIQLNFEQYGVAKAPIMLIKTAKKNTHFPL